MDGMQIFQQLEDSKSTLIFSPSNGNVCRSTRVASTVLEFRCIKLKQMRFPVAMYKNGDVPVHDCLDSKAFAKQLARGVLQGLGLWPGICWLLTVSVAVAVAFALAIGCAVGVVGVVVVVVFVAAAAAAVVVVVIGRHKNKAPVQTTHPTL